MKTHHSFLAFCLLFFSFNICYAGDPVITGFGSPKTTRNATLLIKGSGFGSDFEAVRVEINGKKQFVTGVQDNEVWVLTDGKTAYGKAEIVLKVKGKQATGQIEVVDPKELSGNIGSDSAGGQKEEPKQLKIVEVLTLAVGKTESGLNCFKVDGVSKDLIDDMTFQVSIKFGGALVSSGTVTVKSNKFSHNFRGLKGKIPPGNYQVDVLFIFRRQRAKLKAQWKKANKGPKVLKKYKTYNFESILAVGSEDQVNALRDKFKASYSEAIDKLDKAYEELQTSYALSAMTFFKKGKKRKLDLEKWQKWIVDAELVVDEATAKKLVKNKKFVRGVYINQDNWVKTVNKNFAVIEDVFKTIRPLRDVYIKSPLPKVDTEVRRMCQALMGITITRTQELYKKNTVKFDANELPKVLGVRIVEPMRSKTSADYRSARLKANNVINPPKIVVGEPGEK